MAHPRFTVPRSVPVKLLGAALAMAVLAACGGGGPTDTLAAPTGVVATSGPGYITVTWQDNSTDETGFEVYRTAVGANALTVQQSSEPVATLPANAVEFVDHEIDLETLYDYSVVAIRGATKSSAAAAAGTASVPIGVDLMVGTIAQANPSLSNGTMLVAYLVLPRAMLDDAAVTIETQIVGPEGWNSGFPIRRIMAPGTFARSHGFQSTDLAVVAAVAGTYTVTMYVDGVEQDVATAELADPTYRFPRAENFTVVTATEQTIVAEWDPAPGMVSQYPRIIDRGSTPRVGTYPVPSYVPGEPLEGVDLDTGVHTLQLISANADMVAYPVKVDQFGVSQTNATFTVGDVLTGECSDLDQTITVPDAALRNAIADAVGTPGVDLTCLEFLALESLTAGDAGIASLEGLQYAVNMKNAYLHNLSSTGPNVNTITDVTPLQSLSALERLSLQNNPIEDVTPIAGLTGLITLILSGTPVSDIGFLVDFDAMWNLQISNSAILDLTPIHGLTTIEYLGIEGLSVTDIGFLENYDNITSLWLGSNSITSLAPLVANPGMGSNDLIDVRYNNLDLTNAGVQADIQALRDRGVTVTVEPQK